MDCKALTIEAAKWSPEAEKCLSGVMPFCGVEELAAQIERGATLFRVSLDEITVGFYVLRIDKTVSRNEGVVVAASGRLNGVDLVAMLAGHIEGQFIGCDSVRFHTGRPGLAKKMAKAGYSCGEIIMRKELK